MNAPAPDHPVSWGTDQEFAWLYDSFLDAVYQSPSSHDHGSGRQALVESIAALIRDRGARRVLDCAAGTGFPALDLATGPASELDIHCTDASAEMLHVLVARARRDGIDIGRFIPPQQPAEPGRVPGDGRALQLDWIDLGCISGRYDYVMCRGNSLAYTNSWSGARREVASVDLIRHDLRQIAARVRPGGHLHVDAPWQHDLPAAVYPPVASGALSIREEVTTERERRYWQLDFELPTGHIIKFERYSSLVTIHDLEAILVDLGFEETSTLSLAGERPGLGVIVARRP